METAKNKWEIAFLDWNGAFINDVVFSYNILVQTFLHFGLQIPSIETFRKNVSQYYFLTAYQKMGLPDSISVEEVNRLRIQFFGNGDGVALHGGAKEFLETCRTRGIYTAFITGEVREVFELCIQKFGISPYINTYKTDVHDKATVFCEILHGIIGCDPQDAFCIDDSPGGVLAAKKLNIFSIGFTRGICLEPFLLAAEPRHSAGSYEEISRLLF